MADLRIRDTVARLRNVPKDQRTAALDKVLGESRDLDFNAHLISALREAEVWPHGCKALRAA
jgi:hypothetical protein